MKNILLLTTADFGGAGLYNLELIDGLSKCGFNVQMLVAKKRSSHSFVTHVPLFFWQKLLNKFGKNIPFTIQNRSVRIKKTVDKDYTFLEPYEQYSFYTFKQIINKITIKPDVIIACWTSGFLTYDLIGKIGKYFSAQTYVYTADMSPFTGGCHYSWSCTGYKNSCNNCPALQNKFQNIASDNLIKKLSAIKKYNIKALAFSRFTLDQLKVSFLFKKQVKIPFFQGYISSDYFHANNRISVREDFNLSLNKIIILLGAINLYEKRKGFIKLINALNIIEKIRPDLISNLMLLAVGAEKKIDCAIEIRFLPFTQDKNTLGDYYRIADIYANASLQDSGPQMLLQAMACGAIPVSFDTGFGSDLINGITGFKVPVGDVELYANALIEAIELSEFKKNKMLNAISDKIKNENSLAKLSEVFNAL